MGNYFVSSELTLYHHQISKIHLFPMNLNIFLCILINIIWGYIYNMFDLNMNRKRSRGPVVRAYDEEFSGSIKSRIRGYAENVKFPPFKLC